VPGSNASKTRNPLKLAGVPKLTKGSQSLVGVSSPYCKDMYGRYCCSTSFFRLSICALIVERLAKDTTADELTAFLQNEGLDGITCRRLQAQIGRQFSAAAFFVSCRETHRSKFL